MVIHPVILSGGSGSRLWPLSREHYPKQLLALVGERTLLQETVCHLEGVKEAAEPIVVCNEEHRFLVAEQIRQLGGKPSDIILEPAGRNTAPALTLAALAITQGGVAPGILPPATLVLPCTSQDGVMLVMPSDHVILDRAAFVNAVRQGAELAAQGALVTFGIIPTSPQTGYGYIKQGEPLSENNAYRVAAFVEKPDFNTAESYLADGRYYWNSGIFMMRAETWLNELDEHRPDIAAACRAAYAQGKKDGDFYRPDATLFSACPSDSIDYAVMEKTAHAVVIPLNAGWSDIGAWPALWEVCPQDAQGNVIRGDVSTHATQNALLIAQHRFLAVVGVEDIIVVETADAVLVVHKDHAQHVKEIVAKLKAEQREEYKTHRKVHRPWGTYEGVDAGPRFQVKRICVHPGAALSLQMHHHRAEHWIVVKGTAKVTRGEEVFLLSENQSTYIPIGVRHRLENPGTLVLEMIEVQSGSYLGEDDIVRFADNYNRE
ncbi:MAG TPA: mannose-1-phosphate guanylyltransferase/mannose-6-phosphate isomerase [Gammaproteobacteria bacterium]|nr:mannose-1-phosphate guanylyltransferase/mannose-6-phosphate isomerase [Gammaproteobacteria bacterium]